MSLRLLHASSSSFLQKLHLAAVAPTGWKAVEAAISQRIISHDQRDALLHADSRLGINSQSLHKIKMHFVILMQYLAHQQLASALTPHLSYAQRLLEGKALFVGKAENLPQDTSIIQLSKTVFFLLAKKNFFPFFTFQA